MQKTIYVINPNSCTAVTAGIDAAMTPLRSAGAAAIECLTLTEGPAGIQSEHDVAMVALPLERQARALAPEAAALVIACFSDPGLPLLREAVDCPVYGIAESAAFQAMMLGRRFGVIAILQASIPRHLRYWGAMGITERLAGEAAIGLGVAELGDAARTLERMIAAGRTLRDSRGADVVIMGCAGMAAYRDELEAALGIPVVEPSQAAVAMAVGGVRLGWTGRAGRAAVGRALN